MELSRVLRGVLAPSTPHNKPYSLHEYCIRTAAIYAVTSLYEFHHKRKNNNSNSNVPRSSRVGTSHPDHHQHQHHHQQQQQQAVHRPVQLDPLAGNPRARRGGHSDDPESKWDEVFPLLDAHFLQLVPTHLYEQFLDNVLCALEVAGHFDQTGNQLMPYVHLFFPKSIRRFRAQKYADRVLMPTIICLKCTHLEELYLQKADSPAITTYLLAHVLKFLNQLRVVALPKQCDDDVASVLGINCPKLESVVLTGTCVTNNGLAWLLCCRKLHTIVMQGFFSGITPKGVALLLKGLPTLRHVINDVMSDVLTYVDFNTSELVLPKFGLKSFLFHSTELLSSNHLELLTKLCPDIEWLSLNSALGYNLEGLGKFPRLSLLRLNYKSHPIDSTVENFLALNGERLTTLHLFEVRDIHLNDLYATVGQCISLENLVLVDCTFMPDWSSMNIPRIRGLDGSREAKMLSSTVSHIQLLSFQCLPHQLVTLMSLFRHLQILEMDRCNLDLGQMKQLLLEQPELHTLRCQQWSHTSAQNLAELQLHFRNCNLQMSRQSFAFEEDDHMQQRTLAASLLSEFVGFSPIMNFDTVST